MSKRIAANAAASKISALYVGDSDEEKRSDEDDEDDDEEEASQEGEDEEEDEEEEEEVIFVTEKKNEKKRTNTPVRSDVHNAVESVVKKFKNTHEHINTSSVEQLALISDHFHKESSEDLSSGRRKRKQKASVNSFAGFLGAESNDVAPDPEIPIYIVENSKSNRAKCFKCENKIDKDIVRIGVISDTSMGLFTKWSHLGCIIFHKNITDPTALDGYLSISPSQREEVVNRVFESASLVDQDLLPINPEDLVRKEWTEEKEPSAEFTMELLPYQKEGLGWMVHQEGSGNAGGILADEMGMGKTAQAIALLLSNKSPPNIKKQAGGEDGKTFLCTGGTLIIVPTVAMHQWIFEIAKFTKADSLKIKMYHGDTRDGTIDNLTKGVDVIITTYKIVEIEYRKANSHDKMTCKICGKKYKYEQYRNHRKYFCGIYAKRTEKQSKTEIRKKGKGEVGKVVDSDDEDSNVINLADSDDDSISRMKKANKQAILKNNFSTKEEKGPKKGRGSSSSNDCEADYEDEEDDTGKGKKGKGKGGSKKKLLEEEDFEMLEHIREIEHEITVAKAKNAKAKKDLSILHEIEWFRVVLDEAHMIKDRSTSTAKAVFSLAAQFRWCLTGTPLQNRVSELYSQIRFLRIDPHAYYFCKSKGCSCRSLNYNFTRGRCDDCDHSSMQHYCHFNKNILNPIKREGYVGEGRRAMLKLRDQILDEILMRRTKLSRADDIQLPPRIVKVRSDRMTREEEDYYQALYTQSQTQFNTYVRSGTVLNNYAHIFDILIRLRQAVDHPYLVIHSNKKSNDTPLIMPKTKVVRVNSSNLDKDDDVDITCPLCHDPVVDQVLSACCRSRFCRSCVQDYIETLEVVDAAGEVSDMGDGGSKKPKAVGIKCPGCQKNLDINLDEDGGDDADIFFENPKQASSSAQSNNLYVDVRKHSILNKLDLPNFQSSTKLEALMEELYKMQATDLNSKAIVFSQFVNMLDLIQHRLDMGCVKSVMLQGSLQVDQRERVIKAFKENVNVKVLLISLKAGGVALNLTVASHIFIMDPWWNPAAEMQAIDRTHRIGQHRPIFATRFIVENSIEERILKLQEKKKLVFDSTIGGDSASIAKLTVEDMKFLFQ